METTMRRMTERKFERKTRLYYRLRDELIHELNERAADAEKEMEPLKKRVLKAVNELESMYADELGNDLTPCQPTGEELPLIGLGPFGYLTEGPEISDDQIPF